MYNASEYVKSLQHNSDDFITLIRLVNELAATVQTLPSNLEERYCSVASEQRSCTASVAVLLSYINFLIAIATL